MARLRLPRLRERPINASGAKPPQPLAERSRTSDGARTNGAGAATATLPPRPPAPPPPPPKAEEPELEPLPPLTLFSKVMLVLIPLGLVALALYLLGVFDSAEHSGPQGPAPRIEATTGSGSNATDLGFPGFATKNTTRVGGSDPAATAAGAALATFPSTVPDDSPSAVTLVPEGDWQAAIAAAALLADPVRAPVLFSGPGPTQPTTGEALDALDPQGSKGTGGDQLIALPGSTVPSGYQTRVVKGKGAAEVAARLAGLRARLAGGPPEHIVVTTPREAGIAMPAAAWAARSGDPVLYAGPEGLPKATAKALAKFKDVPVYILGPTSAIPASVEQQIVKVSGGATRVSGEEPVANAINFARFSDGSFGWNINDPGHGFVIARSNRPLDAAAAAPLSGAGTWGPLLLTDNAATLPGTLRGYLLDVKPGYTTDPTRAFYNHVWVIGDEAAISVEEQAAIDYITELGKVGPQKGSR